LDTADEVHSKHEHDMQALKRMGVETLHQGGKSVARFSMCMIRHPTILMIESIGKPEAAFILFPTPRMFWR
jgi:hypothetical protein